MKADMILYNGKIYSVNGDDVVTRGSAVAVKEGIILETGEDSEILGKYKNDETRLIDCNCNTILPGLCDAHCHPSWTASLLESCSLFDIIGTTEETSSQVVDKYLNAISDFIKEKGDRAIYRGIGWNRAFFTGGCKESRWPDRHDLDRICNDRPVVVESYCQHLLWVNTKALELAGVTRETPDTVSGAIFRDEHGDPTGILMEMEAIDLIKNNLEGYDFTVGQYKDAYLEYQENMALSYGVTLVNDCLCTENAMTAFKELAAEGKLKLRLRGVYDFNNCNDLSIVEKIENKIGSDNIGEFEINTIKVFTEGPIATIDPLDSSYNIEHGNPEDYKNEPFYTDECLKTALKRAAQTGLQIHLHSMGDAAVKQSVEALVYAQNETGTKNRNVIAHLQLVRDEDVKAMGENAIIANCQPRWMIYDSDITENYDFVFGKERASKSFPNKKFLDAGCIVAYGTDFPVIPPPSTLHNIQCAITRSVFEDDEIQYPVYKGTVLEPSEKVSLKDAIKSNSWSGAYQNFLEEVTGSIEPGKSADFAILDGDIDAK